VLCLLPAARSPPLKRGGQRTTAACALQLPLDPAKQLLELTVRAPANEVVIGLMAATQER